MGELTALILDSDGLPLAVLDRSIAPSAEQALNAAGTIVLDVPRGDVKLSSAPLGATLEIRRGTERLLRGRIVARDVEPDIVALTALTEEALLGDARTPPTYGPVLAGLDLADLARELNRRWVPKRVKTTTEWGAFVESSQVAAVAYDQGVLSLAKDASDAYYSSGYAVYQFNSSDFPGFASWDRIRWASDYEAPVYTSVQYRFGTTGTWTPAATATEEDGTVVAGVRGGLPAQIGIDLADATNSVLQVRINLYTSDTTSEDPGGTTQKGRTPFAYALEVIARGAELYTTTLLPASAGAVVASVAADRAPVLEVLRTACESVGWAFWMDAGQLDLRALDTGADQTDLPLITAGDERAWSS